MLNQQSYTEKRDKLTQDIEEAQRDFDVALAETEGRTDARVNALRHALTSLVQQRVDLDVAWRATEPEIARQQAAEDVQHRRAALATIEAALTDAIRIAAGL